MDSEVGPFPPPYLTLNINVTKQTVSYVVNSIGVQ